MRRKLSLLANITSLIISLALLLVSASAIADSGKTVKFANEKQTVRYDVYAGGVHALQADLNVDLTQAKKYDVSLTAKTYGFLGKLAPWKGTFSSTGWKQGNKGLWQPKEHKSETTWRDELEVKKYSYNKDGSFKRVQHKR